MNTVVAIHGAVANAATWIPLTEAVRDVDVIADDLPGHGIRRSEPFTLAAALDGIVRRVRSVPEAVPIVLVGDSLGGYLALAAARRLGDRISGVVAGSCTFPLHGVEGWTARLSLLAEPLVNERVITAMLRHACSPEVFTQIAARGLAPAMRGVTLRALLGRDILAELPALRVPVTFINGALDLPIAWYGPRFAAAAQRGRLITIPGATHGVGLTHPRAFADAVLPMFSLGGAPL